VMGVVFEMNSNHVSHVKEGEVSWIRHERVFVFSETMQTYPNQELKNVIDTPFSFFYSIWSCLCGTGYNNGPANFDFKPIKIWMRRGGKEDL
jgi:hypothetical protein